MPFKVHYEIFDNKHAAPDYQTYDFTMARIEWQERQRNPKGLMWRLEQTPMPDGELTKEEEYLLLVYTIRKLWRRYFDQGRKQEDLKASLAEEKKLDDWNTRTRKFIDSHSNYGKGAQSEGYSFFLVVEAWRKAWKDYKKYLRGQVVDGLIEKEMGKQCRDYEKQIDKYVKDKLGLI